MTQQIINTGTAADKGNGDPLRTAFTKVNDNFTELYTLVGAASLTELAQDYAAEMFTEGTHVGVTVEYDDAANVINLTALGQTSSGDTAPVNPTEGALWWDSVSGRLYVYYGSTWVDASPVDGAGISSTNELVNGAYIVNLGSTGTLTTPGDIQLGDNGSLTFPDATVQTTAWTGSELIGATVAAVGGTASADETGITYSNKIAIFTEGAFTVGEWTDVQIGWTVTDNNGFTDTIASRGGFGAASFVTTVSNWPAPASGKTYVFTSPDYQPASTNPVEITVGNNNWSFGDDGGLTLPASGTVSFTPTTPSNWTGTAPTTIQEAINRIAAILANQGITP